LILTRDLHRILTRLFNWYFWGYKETKLFLTSFPDCWVELFLNR
jgi:hypothetical protein